MRNAELVADRLVVQSGSNHSGHRAADLAPWHSSVVQMSASPRVIRPRAWPDWSLHSARSTARCLSGVSGAGREPDAARETAGARRRAIKIKIKMKGARACRNCRLAPGGQSPVMGNARSCMARLSLFAAQIEKSK